jgi:heme/copper-type cytochrome/quinol oxidase subunit 2
MDKLTEENVRSMSVQAYNEKNLHISDGALPINFEFDSNLVSDEDLEFGAHRILEVDNRLFLPVGVPVRLLITSSDVLHS